MDSQTSISEKTIIPVEGQGIVGEELGLEIFRKHGAAINNRDICIEFKIGKNITRTAPEFWHSLLSPVLSEYYREARDNDSREKRIEILNLVRNRFSLGYEHEEVDSYFKYADEVNRKASKRGAFLTLNELEHEMGKRPSIPEHLKSNAHDCNRIRHTFIGMRFDYENRVSALAYPDMKPVEPADVLRGWLISARKAEAG